MVAYRTVWSNNPSALVGPTSLLGSYTGQCSGASGPLLLGQKASSIFRHTQVTHDSKHQRATSLHAIYPAENRDTQPSRRFSEINNTSGAGCRGAASPPPPVPPQQSPPCRPPPLRAPPPTWQRTAPAAQTARLLRHII